MNVPTRYSRTRESLPAEVSFGCGGINLFTAEELEKGQVGYAIAPDGTSLSKGCDGAWKSDWLVIGYEIGCGDPLFIDTGDSALPVFTATHGEGAWEPVMVANSVETFARCVQEFSFISAGRGNPVECDNNPLSDEDRRSFLDRIAQANGTTIAPEFWDILLTF